MPTTIETAWIDGARAAILDTFGQAVTYEPGVLDRAITAVIRYDSDDAQVSPVARHRSPKVYIKVANDSTLGISADEFDSSKKVSLPPRPGAAARNFHLARIVKASGVWVTYECH